MLPCGSASMRSTVNRVSQAIVSASPRLMVHLPTPPLELMTAAAVPDRSVGVIEIAPFVAIDLKHGASRLQRTTTIVPAYFADGASTANGGRSCSWATPCAGGEPRLDLPSK